MSTLQMTENYQMLLFYATLFFIVGLTFFSMVLWAGGDISGAALSALCPIALGLYALWKQIKGE